MYVDGYYDRQKDEIYVVERDENRNRIFKNYLAEHTLYYTDPNGKYKSMYGDSISKYTTHSSQQFQKEKKNFKKTRTIFESDIKPIFRCFENNYKDSPTPELNIGFFDIEVDVNPQRGFAPISDPFNEVTAISLYTSYSKTLITLVVPPKTISLDYAEEIASEFENTLVFEKESEMLDAFLQLIDDVDVLTGWNSTGYDIPYIIGRISRALGKDETARMCLWNKSPKKRDYIKFKKKTFTYDLIGRVHLDYLELFQKHNPQQLHSYRLDYVGEIVTGERKVQYAGTLDGLYKNDFKLFIEYNRQDVMLIVKIDQKKKYIELANQIAHTNCVDLSTTMGSVVLVEQAITLSAHERGMIVCDKEFESATDEDELDDSEPDAAVGAYVANPVVGISEEIGCADINSLYPSTLRALNMSPETLFGQIRPIYTDRWIEERLKTVDSNMVWDDVFSVIEYDHVFNRTNDVLVVDLVDGSSLNMRAYELHDLIFSENSKLVISANGTIFRTDTPGIIPNLLETWYSQRKIMQKREAIWETLLDSGIEVNFDL